MMPGVAATPFTLIQREALDPQPFTAVTHNCPVLNDPVYVTSTVLLPLDDASVAPDGNTQLYDVTPLIAGTE